MTQAELGEWASQNFGLDYTVSQKTISNILNNSDKIYELMANGNTQGKSSKTQKSPLIDDVVAKYIEEMNAANLPVNHTSVLLVVGKAAHDVYKLHELPEKERLNFSVGWLSKLFHRIDVKPRHLYGEHSSVNLSNENIVGQLEKIKELLKPYDPKDIMNFDETGLYYEQQPTRTICKTQLGGVKKSKNRFTVDLLTNFDGSYKGHPIVIGKRKTPRSAKRRPLLYSKTTVGQTHYVEYHQGDSAWMNADIFSKYIRRLNASFAYADRKVAILVDNASVHKTKQEFIHIKLIYLPANTTSKLQPLDAGIIANFKGFFRNHQYQRAVNSYFAKTDMDHLESYRMDEVQALFFWADSWLKVKPSTIRNCWEKTKIIDFKFSNDVTYDDLDKLPGASEVVPLDEDIVNSIIDIIPQLPGNTTDSHGHQLISRVDQPELNTNEESLIVCQPSFVEVDTAEEVEEEVTPTEIEDDVVEEDVDTEKTRSELKRAWEVIMLNEVPYNEESHSVIKNCRRRIAEYKLEEIVERKQTDLREYFVSNDRS